MGSDEGLMKNWQDVEMPPSLAARPRDPRGFPITFVTLIDHKGKPDFTTIDARKIIACIQQSRCGMCGEAWPSMSNSPEGARRSDDHLMAFIGGPLSCQNRNFLDPPMHVECAEYAMKVCPHITTPTARYKKQVLGGPDQREVFDEVAAERPEKFGLYVTDGCRVIDYQGQPVFIANPPSRLEWTSE
jgi:hypothetical protein